MLHHFGLTISDDRRLKKVDPKAACQQVTRSLAKEFGFSPHKSALIYLDSDKNQHIFKTLLRARGIPASTANEAVNKFSQSQRATTAFSSDLLYLLPNPTDYIIFIGQVPDSWLPLILSQVVTHGEHECDLIINKGVSYSSYKERFHSLTRELLGFAGRSHIVAVSGLYGKYTPQINLHQRYTEDDLAHDLAYFIFDAVLETSPHLPVKELFHSPNELQFWQLIKGLTGKPVNISFSFPKDTNFQPFVQSAQKLIHQAHGDEVVNLVYSPHSNLQINSR